MTLRPLIAASEISTPIGPISLATSEKGICFVEFGSLQTTRPIFITRLKRHHIVAEVREDSGPLIETAEKQISDYFTGVRKRFDLPLDLFGTAFQKLVWHEVEKIPYGSTASYKQIAINIGAPRAVRAIGGANNKNPIPIIIPCHRVIGSNGAMVGYGGGLDKKEALLKHEGALKTLTS
ncbi:methylated-DNA--[protein]-cysteine S-methyltransferase [Salipaludibacillus agaradhaerens]|uniref:methylated-DNA--[protein]-cysteine S-methyltransferase n=1 Tax=Salipaludibacillus agaradhaerens TaxID=76935 RepID=UPI00215085CF|nr:methylated-DNA--[protein]-cysteine S-methyltransferase [Salipaludibacillus agaradhaerens]MCR6106026.1 methylated-DNA--[protein]-cysteine S-methyltransferase [Salipaludibacillus agaradhaerens]MCR6118059.1 methylated-DNA--[protein]-cysteine S-methyltransferase [Salipaludibacillus agaradhaerens]